MSVPSDVRSTECHGYHPQDEAVCQQLMTVRLNLMTVKGAREWSNRTLIPSFRIDDTPFWDRYMRGREEYNELGKVFMSN